MSNIVNKDKCNNIQKHTHVEDNNTSDQEQETQLDTANSHSGSRSYMDTTSNMIYHLDSEHKITKNNHIDRNIETFMEAACGKIMLKKQTEIETAMMTWMIDDCQLFYLLQTESFKTFMKVAVFGFKLLDLWSSRTDKPYIGITVGWLDLKNWTLKEGLLACEKIKGRYTDENIQDTIVQIIDRFQLKQKLVAATTDNGANVVKAIRLIDISHVPCSAHTLHLSVLKGLNIAKPFKKRITNLILFFYGSTKQTENLKNTQCKLNYPKIYKILIDIKTRWNSTYLAWCYLLELKNAII
ncbi:5753_t:CDS:2 [Cetraspora pellucida]|uniref:5753_t:CDS:1 n=1 Tax=Cetraspora pellucida TaxID=1433469 RepID=A0A9N8ZE48_9GLOM|nr:5753_t:CDS:2 [Cetraspora pellucida]